MKLHLSEDLALPADAITQTAHGMAMDLLRNGFGDEGARLVIATDDGRDLGGWCLAALVEKFAAAIASELEKGYEAGLQKRNDLLVEMAREEGREEERADKDREFALIVGALCRANADQIVVRAADLVAVGGELVSTVDPTNGDRIFTLVRSANPGGRWAID